MKKYRLPLLWLCSVAMAGCVAPSQNQTVPAARTAPVASRVPATNPTPPTRGFIPPQIMRGAGLDEVIGAGTTRLLNLFGTPALDVPEGDARKLQFRGQACVLDIFLYPVRPDAGPSATWIEARRPDTGRDVDRADCIAALKR